MGHDVGCGASARPVIDCLTYFNSVAHVVCCAGTSHRRPRVPFSKRVILTSYLQNAPQVLQKASKLSIRVNIRDLRIIFINMVTLGLACY